MPAGRGPDRPGAVGGGRLVRFHYFSGTGEIVEDELADDPSIVKLCAQAFEAAWERAIPHDLYRPV